MRMTIATEKFRKDAFRTAYDFLEKHNRLLSKPEEFQRLADETTAEGVKHAGDDLTLHLLTAVFLFITETSEKVNNL